MQTLTWSQLMPRYTGAIKITVEADEQVLADYEKMKNDDEVADEIEEIVDYALKDIEEAILTGLSK